MSVQHPDDKLPNFAGLGKKFTKKKKLETALIRFNFLYNGEESWESI